MCLPASRKRGLNNAYCQLDLRGRPLGSDAFTLANLLRTLTTQDGIANWSLTSLRERLVKTGARLVRYARYPVFQLAEAGLPRAVFAGILDRINSLRDPPNEDPFAWPGSLARSHRSQRERCFRKEPKWRP